jgi:predicted metal-dependent enzyme (double-stranded beta helix superfamily)
MTLIAHLAAALQPPLRAEVLETLAQRAAHDQRGGVGAIPPPAAGTRAFTRLRHTTTHDVWLISWSEGTCVAAHDHGGSAGALAVVQGSLVERDAVASGSGADDDHDYRVLREGDVRSFDADHRHNVANLDRELAVSVHVYSPPLTTMNFFDEHGNVTFVEAVDDERTEDRNVHHD